MAWYLSFLAVSAVSLYYSFCFSPAFIFWSLLFLVTPFFLFVFLSIQYVRPFHYIVIFGAQLWDDETTQTYEFLLFGKFLSARSLVVIFYAPFGPFILRYVCLEEYVWTVLLFTKNPACLSAEKETLRQKATIWNLRKSLWNKVLRVCLITTPTTWSPPPNYEKSSQQLRCRELSKTYVRQIFTIHYLSQWAKILRVRSACPSQHIVMRGDIVALIFEHTCFPLRDLP